MKQRRESDSESALLISESQLRSWLDRTIASGVRVIAPLEKEPGHLVYEETADAARIAIDPVRPIFSPKAFIHLPSEEITGGDAKDSAPRLIYGVHACDLSGLQILAGAFLSTYTDPLLKDRVDRTAVAGFTCLEPSDNCFCTSMGTGPSIHEAYDLLFTKLENGYLLEVGTSRGRALLGDAKFPLASAREMKEKEEILERTRRRMPKQFKTLGIPELLVGSYGSPVWEEYARLCLGCTNCTMVCPTCYCYDLRDWASPTLRDSGRRRTWDSCQSFSFTSVHGGNYRPDQKARLRQFVCHKLAFWIEQYGVFGCVGCGRCMTWCPTGIDLTVVAETIREREK
jgi:sulfhydrogenase subunit beta (sulfur reductase)